MWEEVASRGDDGGGKAVDGGEPEERVGREAVCNSWVEGVGAMWVADKSVGEAVVEVEALWMCDFLEGRMEYSEKRTLRVVTTFRASMSHTLHPLDWGELPRKKLREERASNFVRDTAGSTYQHAVAKVRRGNMIGVPLCHVW